MAGIMKSMNPNNEEILRNNTPTTFRGIRGQELAPNEAFVITFVPFVNKPKFVNRIEIRE
jgi:hypothetical protein